MIEDESLVVDKDAVEQKPDEKENDGHGPHRPERRLHVLAVPRAERDEAQHDDPEDQKLVLRLDRHVFRYTPLFGCARFALVALSRCFLFLCVLGTGAPQTISHFWYVPGWGPGCFAPTAATYAERAGRAEAGECLCHGSPACYP